MKAHRLRIGRTGRKKERSHGTAKYRLPQCHKKTTPSPDDCVKHKAQYQIIFIKSEVIYYEANIKYKLRLRHGKRWIVAISPW